MQHTSTRQVLAGLLLAFALAALLIGGVLATARQTIVRGGTEQMAVVTSAAVSQVLAAERLAGGDLQPLALSLVASLDDVDQVRVIDSSQRQLAASTSAEDLAAGEVPRRLTREQKDWFDQAKELEANHRTNVSEGAARKDEVLRQAVGEAQLQVVLPLFDNGTVDGSVQVLTSARVPDAGGSPLVPLAALAGAFLVLAVVSLRVRGAPLLLVGLALLVAGIWGYAALGLGNLAHITADVEAAVAAHASRVGEVVRAEAPGTPVDITAWNLDRFGDPRGTYDRNGEVDRQMVSAGFAEGAGRFVQGAVLLGLLTVVFYYWVAAGWAVRTWQALTRHRTAYGFVLPAMIGMIVLVFFPFGYGVMLSFTNQTLYNVNQPLYDLWVGLDNYIDILSDVAISRTGDDGSQIINYQNFYWTLGFTILWTVSNVTIGVTLGLILALILNTKDLAFRPFYRIILILPWAVPNYITALIWKGMFHRQFGVINQVIVMFGGEPLAWFDAWHTSFFAVLATNGWLSFPFMMVVSLGALQAISSDLYEAARVDGASRWQQFWYVTLPSIKPALVPAVILSVVWTFNMFNIIYLVSQGEPAGATEILITDAYKIAFEQYRYGYAAAYSVVIFLILMVYGVWQNRVTRATEGI
jgi:arabinogalactan oligomer/maltooligosaccharide transport system permease protein